MSTRMHDSWVNKLRLELFRYSAIPDREWSKLISMVSGVLYAIAFGLAQGQAQFYLLILAGIFLTAFVSPAYSALSELVHPGLRSSVISVNVLLLNASGFSMGPIFAGFLSDRYGIGTAMIALSLVPFISMLISLVAAALYDRDLAKVEKIELQPES